MRTRNATLLPGAVYLAIAASTTVAAPAEYDFQDPKGVNTIVFMLDSKLEPIMGVAGGIAGRIAFDPNDPKTTNGTITLETKSIYTPNRGMKDKIQAEDWLDGKNHPTIEFTFKSVGLVKEEAPGSFRMAVEGELSLKGVKKTVTTTVTATHMPGALSSRMRSAEGDLLVLRSTFTINRKDFNIKPEMGGDTVSEDVELRISIVGGHAKK